MKRKTTTKKPRALAVRPKKKPSVGAKARLAAERFREYLSPDFTRRLVAHMHKAKKAALEGKE